MAYQNGKRPVTVPAKGNASKVGSPIGPTPAPAKTYVNPVLVERVEPTGYGQKDLGPSSVPPGTRTTSPLADELKRMAALSDGGDMLEDIIRHGTARNVSVAETMAPQTRDLPDTRPAVHPHMSNPNANPTTIPDKLGASATPPVRQPK